MDTPVWDTPDPTKSEKHLSQKKENRARARARAAGRPYPNLIDNMAVSKGVRLDKIASSPAGMRYLKEAPLKGNEFYHGTTKDSVAAIRSEGYSLKQKNKRFGSHFGPGVYGSTHKHYAQSFADLHAKRTGGKPEVLRMAIPKNSKLLTVDGWDNTIKTPQATRKGYAGISATLKHDKSKYNITTIANPKNVKIVNNRYRPTKQAGKDAAVVATVGGAGYGAYKVKKFDSPAWTRSAGKNPEGGLNAKGRASAKAQGHNLKPPVKSGDNPRRASFLARMGNMPGPERKPNGEPTRLLLSLQKWGASSKEDAKKKAAAMSVGKSMVSPGVYKPARSLSAIERKSVKSGKNYANSQGAAAQARDTRNAGNKEVVGPAMEAMGLKGVGRMRRADIERSQLYTKVKRNVYVYGGGDVARRHAELLPKMRRPTIVGTTSALPEQAAAIAINTGSKSSPRAIMIPRTGVTQRINAEQAMLHEAAHANTKRPLSRSMELKRDPKASTGFSENAKKQQREEARADRYQIQQTGKTIPGSYRAAAQNDPIGRRHYISHNYKLWGKENPVGDKAVKYGTGAVLAGAAYGVNGKVNKGIRRIPGQMEIPGIGNVVRQTAKRRLPTEGRWKHLSGKTSRIRIIGPHSSVKGSFDVLDSKDNRYILPRDRIVFMKPDDVTKALEYSVVMNQSRFGGSGIVGKAFDDKPKPVWEKPSPPGDSDPLSKKRKASAKARAKAAGRPYPNLIDNMAAARVKKEDSWKNISHYQDKGAQGRRTRNHGTNLVAVSAFGAGTAGRLNASRNGRPIRSASETYNKLKNVEDVGVTPLNKLRLLSDISRRNPIAGLALGSVGLGAVGAGMYAAGSSKNRYSQAKIAELRRKRGAVRKASAEDGSGRRISGNTALGIAGVGSVGLGAKKISNARNMPIYARTMADSATNTRIAQENLTARAQGKAASANARMNANLKSKNPWRRISTGASDAAKYQSLADKSQQSLNAARNKERVATSALANVAGKQKWMRGAGLAAVGGGTALTALAARNAGRKSAQ